VAWVWCQRHNRPTLFIRIELTLEIRCADAQPAMEPRLHSKGAVGRRQHRERPYVPGALGWRLSAGEMAALDEASDKVGKSTSQNIFQTA